MGRSTDLSNCYIYHIVDKENIVHYVGSTSNMNSRKSSHRYRCNTEHDKKYHLDIYQYIRNNGGFDNFEILPIRKLENISNKTELLIAEQAEMNKFSNLKNKNGSYRTKEESKKQKNEYNRQYREKNKDQIHEKAHQYYESKKEQRLEYQRNYIEKNKDQLNEKRRQKYQQKKQLKDTYQ
jgi:hypothetical protein